MKTFWTGKECFASVLDIAPCALVVLDREGRVAFASRETERLTGLGREEIIGRSYDDPRLLLTREDGTPLPLRDHPFNLAQKSGKPVYGLKYAFSRAKEERIFLSVNAAPLQGPEGKSLGVALALEDITEARRRERLLEEERRRAEVFLEAAGTMMVALDREGTVTLINERGCEILGRRKHEVVGKNWFENFLPSRVRKEVEKAFKGLIEGGRREIPGV